MLRTSATVTYASGFDEDAKTAIDQGECKEMMVREERGGLVAGSERMGREALVVGRRDRRPTIGRAAPGIRGGRLQATSRRW